MAKRPKVLVIGSYGPRDRSLTRSQVEAADMLGIELGKALIDRDIDLLFGGAFDLAEKIVAGAEAACAGRTPPLRDRLVTFHTTAFPPGAGANLGQLYRRPDDEAYWTHVLMEADAVVAISGRANTRTVLDLALALHKPVFPIGLFEGASQDVLARLNDPTLHWLGDHGGTPGELALKLAENIARRYAPPWIVGQVFVIMSFGADRSVYDTIVTECAKLKLEAKRADDRPEASLIIDEVKNYILESEFLIVDLTHERPNVYYELGFAHGAGNQASDILLIAHKEAEVHFDIAGLRVHRYDSLNTLGELIRKQFAILVKCRRSQDKVCAR